jgi:CCR4-NOT transcription complex subunit 2
MRQKSGPFREGSITSQSSLLGAQASGSESRNPHGAIGAIGAVGGSSSAGKAKDDAPDQPTGDSSTPNPNVQDYMPGMSEFERWSLRGMRHMMNLHPDHNALLVGLDTRGLALDTASSDLISEQIWSVADDVPPRPAVPNFRIPECYKVNNVQPIENKIPSFNEETLFWIFYSCPQDVKQMLASIEL